jgi:hypothetical protein
MDLAKLVFSFPKEINKKISLCYNLLKDFHKNYNVSTYLKEITFSKLQLLNFVEFQDYILVEIESICDAHYINLLPVYDLYGNIKNNLRYKLTIDKIVENKLILPPILVKILGINYTYKEEELLIELIEPFMTDDIKLNLTEDGLFLLSVYFLNYFSLIIYLKIKSNIFNLSEIMIYEINKNIEYIWDDIGFYDKDKIKSKIKNKNKDNSISCRTEETFNNNKLYRYKDDKNYYINDFEGMPNDFIYDKDTHEIENYIYK